MHTLHVDTAMYATSHSQFVHRFAVKQWAAFCFQAGYVSTDITVAGGLLGMLQ